MSVFFTLSSFELGFFFFVWFWFAWTIFCCWNSTSALSSSSFLPFRWASCRYLRKPRPPVWFPRASSGIFKDFISLVLLKFLLFVFFTLSLLLGLFSPFLGALSSNISAFKFLLLSSPGDCTWKYLSVASCWAYIYDFCFSIWFKLSMSFYMLSDSPLSLSVFCCIASRFLISFLYFYYDTALLLCFWV